MTRPRLVCVATLATTVLLGAGGPAARADSGQAVIDATIYGASSGSVAVRPVTLDTLDGCPLYDGSSPMYLYPGDQPYSPAASSSWALATVITCALGQPLNAVDEVQVDNPSHGFENPLSNAELSQSSQYQDPAAPDALPVLSVDGSENQNTYVRPWLGGSDDNAVDQVVSDGAPIAIVVYENAAPLTVNATQRTVSRTAKSIKVAFRAKVRGPGGSPVPASDLSWSWEFGDGTSSTRPDPRHSFVPGLYPVTLQVTDTNAGTGGTATIDVSFNPSSSSGSGNRSGAGRSRKSHAPTGPVHSSGTHPGGSPGDTTGGAAPSTAAGGNASTAPPPATQAPAEAPPSPAVPAAPATAPRTPGRSHPKASLPSTTPATAAGAVDAGAPVVAGLLISDPTPLPARAIPALRASGTAGSAPPVRAAIRGSILPLLGSVLAIVALFGLGAARELGAIGWRGLRFLGWSR